MKKSHILLAEYLIDNIDDCNLKEYKKAFYLGNILPDCKPSFITTRHEFDVTFDKLKNKIRILNEEQHSSRHDYRAYFMKLGEVAHYLADFFTFPHNSHYDGNLIEHTQYEKQMSEDFEEYITRGDDTWIHTSRIVDFTSLDDIFSFIRTVHGAYMKTKHTIEEDIHFIMTMCFQVIHGLINMMETEWNNRVVYAN